jgi:hypothetical protein
MPADHANFGFRTRQAALAELIEFALTPYVQTQMQSCLFIKLSEYDAIANLNIP